MPQRIPASDGQGLAVDVRGDGPLVLVVAGGPGRAAAYLGDLGGLAARLVLPDPRGSGGSRPAEPDTLRADRLAEDLVDVCVALELPPVAVVAHSYGCRIAELFAASAPERVRALVLLTPPPREADEAYLRAAGAVVDAREATADGDPVLLEAVEAARAMPTARPRDRAYLEAASLPLWYARWDDDARAHAASAADQTVARTALTLRQEARGDPPDLTGLAAPVTVLGGELDLLAPPAAVERVAASIPGAGFAVLPGCSHFPWIDDPAAVVKALTPLVAAGA